MKKKLYYGALFSIKKLVNIVFHLYTIFWIINWNSNSLLCDALTNSPLMFLKMNYFYNYTKNWNSGILFPKLWEQFCEILHFQILLLSALEFCWASVERFMSAISVNIPLMLQYGYLVWMNKAIHINVW